MKALIKRAIRAIFELGQRFGVDVLPRHFYSEIPDMRRLRRESAWRRAYSLQGIAGSEHTPQLEFVRSTVTTEVRGRLGDKAIHDEACRRNGAIGFGKIEAEFLYAYVSTWKPSRIIQVGAGVSTAVCLAAATDARYRPRITCVDPFPTGFLRDLAKGGEIDLVAKPVQDLDASLVENLGPGDLFFVDSTHTLGPAGEVSWLILELLPRLRPGVRAHFHDVVFPYDYFPDTLSGALFFGHESVLLQAFLTLNPNWRIMASLSILHYRCAAELREIFAHYRPMTMSDGLCVQAGDFPSSIYLEVASPPLGA
jgi:hypothetical protein